MGMGQDIGLRNIVEDLTPQLGGNLDVNGKALVSVNDGNIALTPNGTGVVVVSSHTQLPNAKALQLGDSQQYTVQFDGTNAVHTSTSGTVYFTGALVGIGGVPTATFHVHHTGVGMKFERNSGGASAIDLINTQYTYRFGLSGAEAFMIQDMTAAGDPIRFYMVKNTGYLGLGDDHTSPLATLDVKGTTRLGDSTTNYAAFAADGELTLVGTARVMKTIDMAGSAFAVGAGTPTATAVGNYAVWIYAINDAGALTFEVPHDWAVGSDITIKIDWAIDRAFADESAEIQWNVAWSAVPHDASEALDAASTTLDPGDLAIPATAKALTRTIMGTIAGGSLAAEDEIGLLVTRVALDGGSNPGAAKNPFITHVYVEYLADKLGEAT